LQGRSVGGAGRLTGVDELAGQIPALLLEEALAGFPLAGIE